MITNFTVIRHGETAANQGNIIQGQTDVPLSETGEMQARMLAKRWKNKKFDAVYSSDLSRARRTAELVLPDQPATPTPLLREMDLGHWCGLGVAEIAERFPDEWKAFRTGSYECKIAGGETRRELFARAEKFFTEAAAKHRGQNVLVVTHGGLLRAFFLLVMGGEKAKFELLPSTGNTGISVAKYDDEKKQWRLVTWNDTAHLESLLDGDDAY